MIAHRVEVLIEDFVIDNGGNDLLGIDRPSRRGAESGDKRAGLDKNAVCDPPFVLAATGIDTVRVRMPDVQVLAADEM